MTFNYAAVFDDLKAALPAAEITYQPCTSDGRPGMRTDYFLITTRIHEPTFRADLTCLTIISKESLRGHRNGIIAFLKRAIEDACEVAVQKRLVPE